MKNTKTEDCTARCEKSLRDLLIGLENMFKKHLKLFKSNLGLQNDIIDSMWMISQRFLILTRGCGCVRPYPREESDRKEREMRAEFKFKQKALCGANRKLNASLEALKQKCRAFDRVLAITIDPNVPSEIIEGNNTRKPLYYFIELYADLLKFFGEAQNRLASFEWILIVDDIRSIEEYKNNLKPDEAEIDYFEGSMFQSTGLKF